jgi:hypothetical protein
MLPWDFSRSLFRGELCLTDLSSYFPDCPVAHPGLAKDYNTATYKVTNGSHYSRHRCDRAELAAPVAAAAPVEQESVGLLGGLMKTIGLGGSSAPVEKKEVKAETSGDMDGLWLYLYPNTGGLERSGT